MSKMGISVHLVLSRRLQLRGGRPVARAGRRSSSPACPRASPASACAGIAAEGRSSCTQRAWDEDGDRAAGRRLLQVRAAAARRHAFEARLIHMLQDAVRHRRPTRRLQAATAEAVRAPAADHAARPARLPRRAASRCRSTRSRAITEIRKRFVTPGMSLGALGPEAHETLNIAMNRIGAKSDSRRGRRGPGALQAAAQRRQRQLGDQAGRLGPLRRHRGISEQLPRDRDQGRPGRQARRGRPAARLQGHRDDRPPAPLDAGRDADLPPPHHDIYSIEDLAQLIYDLKQINPDARVTA